jgi:hypothetical protein
LSVLKVITLFPSIKEYQCLGTPNIKPCQYFFKGQSLYCGIFQGGEFKEELLLVRLWSSLCVGSGWLMSFSRGHRWRR